MMQKDETGSVVLLPIRGRKPPLAIKNDEELWGLAFQAVRLPNTLSKSEIEQLGLALLMRFVSSSEQ